jgi:hypothetical protein
MPTYLSKYEDHLSALIAGGGSEAAIESAIDEYNKVSPAKLAAWVASAELTCAYCDRPAVANDVRPTDEVTCAEHRS